MCLSNMIFLLEIDFSPLNSIGIVGCKCKTLIKRQDKQIRVVEKADGMLAFISRGIDIKIQEIMLHL